MPPAPTNGTPPQPNGRRMSPSERTEDLDLLAETAALRALLLEGAQRASRLFTALKQHRRQSRAVEAAVASLRQLRLDR